MKFKSVRQTKEVKCLAERTETRDEVGQHTLRDPWQPRRGWSTEEVVGHWAESRQGSLWIVLRDQAHTFRFYLEGGENQGRTLRRRIIYWVGSQWQQGGGERGELRGWTEQYRAPLFVHTTSCFIKDLIRGVKGLNSAHPNFKVVKDVRRVKR